MTVVPANEEDERSWEWDPVVGHLACVQTFQSPLVFHPYFLFLAHFIVLHWQMCSLPEIVTYLRLFGVTLPCIQMPRVTRRIVLFPYLSGRPPPPRPVTKRFMTGTEMPGTQTLPV